MTAISSIDSMFHVEQSAVTGTFGTMFHVEQRAG